MERFKNMEQKSMGSSVFRALVTGAAGFIGSHVVEVLLREGVDVIGVDDLSNGDLSNLNKVSSYLQFAQISILDMEELRRVAEGCQYIFHLAAHTSVQRSVEFPLESHEVNTRGTLNVLEVARANKARVIFSSTSAYYGDQASLPFHEDMCPAPISPYAAQKVLGEHYLNVYHKVHGVEGVSLRYFNVYGPRQRSSGGYSGVITIFKERTLQKQPWIIFGDGKQTRDFVYVEDVARANILAMRSKVPHATVNIGTGIPTDVNTVASLMQKIMGVKAEIIHQPPRPSDPLQGYCDPRRAKEILGFVAEVPLEKGLELTLCSQ
jgi:UDP-glucose 4-epimerase